MSGECVNVRRAAGCRRGVQVIPAFAAIPSRRPRRRFRARTRAVARHRLQGERGETAISNQLRRNALLDLLPPRRIEGLDVGMAVKIEEPGGDRQPFAVEQRCPRACAHRPRKPGLRRPEPCRCTAPARFHRGSCRFEARASAHCRATTRTTLPSRRHRRPFQPTLHLRARRHPRTLQHRLSTVEYNEVRNALHAVARRKSRLTLRIHLQHERFPGHLPRQRVHLRRRHPARPAPRRPEVHQHRHRASPMI